MSNWSMKIREITCLASAEADDDVSDGSVLSLATAVGHHDPPTILLGEYASFYSLSNSADLVHLEQQTVTSLLVDSLS